jgi:dihydrofolate reductase
VKVDMGRVRVHGFSISIDGYGAGPRQSITDPLGVGGTRLHEWFVHTRTFRQMNGAEGGRAGVDDDIAARGFVRIGAWILGRNMFGPVRGPWPDEKWRGWWGENPPYHGPVFVLTHYPREPLTMDGGTIFHFVTDGIEAALMRARAVSDGKDVRIGGGVSTIRQYLTARLIDEMHLAVSPTLLGGGESLLAGLDLPALGYSCTERIATDKATHYTIARGS